MHRRSRYLCGLWSCCEGGEVVSKSSGDGALHLHDLDPWGYNERQEPHRKRASLRDGYRSLSWSAEPQGIVVVDRDVVDKRDVRGKDVDWKS